MTDETITLTGIRDLVGGSMSRVQQWKAKGWLPAPLIAGRRSTRGKPWRRTEWSLYTIEQCLARQSHIRKMRELRATAKRGRKSERHLAALKLQAMEKELMLFDFENPKSIPTSETSTQED